MDYSKYIQYTINTSFQTRPLESAYAYYFSDGTSVSGYEGHYNNIRFRMSNAFNYALSNNKQLACVFKQISTTSYLVIVPSYYDYLFCHSISNYSDIDVIQDRQITISSSTNSDSYTRAYNYYSVGTSFGEYSNIISDEEYGQYFAYGDNNYVYDFTSLYSDGIYSFNNGYQFHVNALYYDLETYGIQINQSIGFGSVFGQVRQESYDDGRSNGYLEGKEDGYQEGLRDGQAMADMTPENATAFSYIGHAFEAVTTVLSIEVLPHITIGTCFSIPLVLILIMTIFKLVRK